eukprot:2327156-Alexandrium_andersonii.AAC.1
MPALGSGSASSPPSRCACSVKSALVPSHSPNERRVAMGLSPFGSGGSPCVGHTWGASLGAV